MMVDETLVQVGSNVGESKVDWLVLFISVVVSTCLFIGNCTIEADSLFVWTDFGKVNSQLSAVNIL